MHSSMTGGHCAQEEGGLSTFIYLTFSGTNSGNFASDCCVVVGAARPVCPVCSKECTNPGLAVPARPRSKKKLFINLTCMQSL
jgi:hypothetical protein